MSKDEELNVLSAIWILSANDENAIITYKGVISRLGLLDEDRIRTLIRNRRDLFRLRIPESRLAAWKREMKEGRHQPVWIMEILNEVDRHAEIENLTVNDVFRNQFRIEDRASKCSLETIDWGLQYIERMRVAAANRRQERRILWSATLSILSVFVTVATLLATTWFQNKSIQLQTVSLDAQTNLKKYEVTFKPRQEGYANVMGSLAKASFVANTAENKAEIEGALLQVHNHIFAVFPFMTSDQSSEIMQMIVKFTQLADSRASARLFPAAGQKPGASDKDQAADQEFQAGIEFGRQTAAVGTRLREILFRDP
jgi:hypothetical protein